MTVRFICVVFVLSLTISCSEHREKRNDIKTNEKSIDFNENENPTVGLEAFEQIPDTIEGCGDYYALDSNLMKDNKFIFLSSLEKFSIVKIKGENIILTRDSVASKEMSLDSFIDVYYSEKVNAVLSVKRVKSYDEGGFYSGTLYIELKALKKKFLYKVYGQSGC